MSDSIKQFYDEHVEDEDTRLDAGKLEFAVTLHTINDILSKIKESEAPLDKFEIVDIGCGTGRYAIELAKQGHNVSACDISSNLVDKTKSNAASAGVTLAAAEVCDACALRNNTNIYKPREYHVSLLLGPLYHLLDGNERGQVFQNTLAVTRPGGYIVAAFVTRNAHLRDLATKDPGRLLAESDFYDKYLDHGKYQRGGSVSMQHDSPDSIRRFLVEQDRQIPYEVVKLVACEGMLGAHHAAHLAKLDDAAFQKWLDAVLSTAESEYSLGAADHILAVLKKH